MAELVNLKEADRYLQACKARMEKLHAEITTDRGTVWSEPQFQRLDSLCRAVVDLGNAVSETLHNNRDGRGTPPARGILNSMMDRSR
jgi:hypothetical protein